jgi:GT2 family glycosyltransferase
MKNNMLKIAVILTCFNRREKTLVSLDTLFKASLPESYEIEVFLVDDGSTDGTGEAVKSQFPMVNVIQGDGSLYWNQGMNLAWQTASKTYNYDYYLWLNDDVDLFKNSISNLLDDYHKSNTKDSIIAGACQSASGEVTYSGYIGLRKKIKLEPNGKQQECDYINGNIVLIPSMVFDKVGFMDNRFKMGHGDFDYGLRARKTGTTLYLASSYCGICELNEGLPIWCNPEYPFSKRLNHFRTPLGGRPNTAFIYQRRHRGLAVAAFHYLTIHIRLIFPSLWIK